MKYLLSVLMVFMFIINGCDKKSTNSNNNDNNVQSYSTVNVKENNDYFDFTTNQGSTSTNSDFDVMFYTVDWQPAEQAPVIKDPRFSVKDGLSIAVIENATLDDVTEVPNTADFITDFVSEKGEWYSETSAHIILPIEKVYIVNTADGKFPVFQIKSYYNEITGDPGYFNIEWKYLSE